MQARRSRTVSLVVLVAALFGALAATALGAFSFSNLGSYPAGQSPIGIASGDWNDDGNADLAVTDFDGDGDSNPETAVTILTSNGAGGFSPAVIPLPEQPDDIAVGKLDGDNDPDLAIGTLTGGVLVLHGGAGSSFGLLQNLDPGFASPRNLDVGDLNGDGQSDIVVSGSSSDETAVMIQKPGAAFKRVKTLSKGGGSVLSVRLNADKRDDLVIVDGNGVFSYVSSKKGKPTKQRKTKVGKPDRLSAADFDADGKRDVVVSSYELTAGKASIAVLRGKGSGAFATPKRFVVASLPGRARGGNAIGLSDAHAAKIDGDKNPDIAVPLTGFNQVAVLRGRDRGIDFKKAVRFPAGNGPERVVAAQFDDAPGIDLGFTRDIDAGILFQD